MKNKKNSYNGDIINTILVIILLLLLLFVVPITIALGLKIPILWYTIVGIVVVVFIRVKIWSLREKKVEKEKIILYGYDKEEADNFTKYFPKKDKDNLIKLAKLISNNKITNYDFITTYLENKNFESFFENLEYITAIDWKAELKDVVAEINELCRMLDYKITLTESDITEKDNQHIKNRRKDRIITAHHDLNVATDILRKQGYEIICLWSEGDAYCISVIPVNKIEEMKKVK